MGNSIQKMAFPAPSPPSDLGYPHRLIPTAKNHQIPVMHFTYPGSKLTLVFSHGNATDLGHMAPYLNHLSQQFKISVVGYEYMGYGHSQLNDQEVFTTSCVSSGDQHPSESGCYESIEAVYQYLTTKQGISPKQIVWMGQSIGTGPTVEISTRYPSAGTVLISPFLSAVKVVTQSAFGYPIDFFCNERKLLKIQHPILIIHGTDDQVIPISHGQGLHRQLVEKHGDRQYAPIWIKGAGHNDILDYQEYYQGLAAFLQSLQAKH